MSISITYPCPNNAKDLSLYQKIFNCHHLTGTQTDQHLLTIAKKHHMLSKSLSVMLQTLLMSYLIWLVKWLVKFYRKHLTARDTARDSKKDTVRDTVKDTVKDYVPLTCIKEIAVTISTNLFHVI